MDQGKYGNRYAVKHAFRALGPSIALTRAKLDKLWQ